MDFFSHPFSIEAALRLLLVACGAILAAIVWWPIAEAIRNILKGGDR